MVFVISKKAIVGHLATLVEVKSCAVAFALLQGTPIQVTSLVIDNHLDLVLTGALWRESCAQLGVMVTHPLVKVVCP